MQLLGTNVKVFAFEPASASYASLCNNIAVNSLDGDIISLCMGFLILLNLLNSPCKKLRLAELCMVSVL